jgi:tetratricopeptide (TPR) repeat protein
MKHIVAVLVLAAPALAQQSQLEQNLAEALAAYARDTTNADAIIWLGRRHAYLGHYEQAVDLYTRGIQLHPQDARMYRHRGHRYITLRQFDDAIRDFEVAARLTKGKPDEIEPDGAPNKYNIPTSTLQSNIWYHLALAHYLKHDFEAALPAWLEAMKVSANDDMKVATADWLYMTYRRLGRVADAKRVLEPITREMRILENDAYHRRLLMYKGELKPEDLLSVDTDDAVQLATFGYGVANWYLYNGQREKAFELFRRIVAGRNPAAFGYIAAEVELAKAR